MRYAVAIVTGNVAKAGTKADISVNVVGEHGDSGFRKLTKSKNNDKPWQQGQTDVFVIESVHLGKIEKVVLLHEGKLKGMYIFVVNLVFNVLYFFYMNK